MITNKNTNNDRSTNDFYLTHAIAAFNTLGYDLAAELLTHMSINRCTDFIYYPLNSNIVYSDSLFYSLMINPNLSHGFDTFENNSNDVSKKDLYYSIHHFNYSKPSSNRGMVLRDRYDFADANSGYDYYNNFPINVVVQKIYNLQEDGILVPFRIEISSINYENTHYVELEKAFPSRWYYGEMSETLSWVEYIYYDLYYYTSSYRTIQTFSGEETSLFLYSSDGSSLTSDNNDELGYLGNALIGYYFMANTHYRLNVKFWGYYKIGTIKTVITPCDIHDYDNFQTIYKSYDTEEYPNHFPYTSLNIVNAYLFIPSDNINSIYVFETFAARYFVDTMLILIDPRRSDTYDAYSNATLDLQPYYFNDDGNDDYQAKLVTPRLGAGVPYLLLVLDYEQGGNDLIGLRVSEECYE